jgi:catechol 2,3-dioxygenase-like lactoylglutathione lyase family enzyme
MYKALYLSPMIPSFNLKETISFFVDLLKFKVVRHDPTYAILSKDNLTIHLLNAGPDLGQMEFYLEVDDVDKVWEHVKEKLKGIKHKAPFDREYGMREIHIAVPASNTLLFVGAEVKMTA